MDQRLKLVRVQMASGLFRRMGLTTVFPGAFGALEFALQIILQVYVDNLTFHIKTYMHHFRWRTQAKYLLIEFAVAFQRVPLIEKHNLSKLTQKVAERTIYFGTTMKAKEINPDCAAGFHPSAQSSLVNPDRLRLLACASLALADPHTAGWWPV